MRNKKRVPLRLFMLYALVLLALANSFAVMAETVTCRVDVNGDRVCSDGSRTRTNVFGDEVTTDKKRG